jgi:hypothetical protein
LEGTKQVVHNLNIQCILIFPPKTNSVLFIDTHSSKGSYLEVPIP